MAKLSFLCHDLWYDNQANPIIRCLPYLSAHGYKIDVIRAASSGTIDSQVWPDVSEETEFIRREKLDDATKSVICSSPDFVLCHHRCITPELLRSNIPIVVFEHSDAPALELTRYLIHLDNVIGVIKGTIFSNKDFYNGPFCEGMFHGTALNNIGLPVVRPRHNITESDLSKIELGYSFGCFRNNKRLLDIDINQNRTNPVCFVGQTNYPRSRLITVHRQAAMKVAKQIGIGISGVPVQEFDRILLSSYVCLSPLGYGACYRSFEGLYAGCIVVQPDCSYMKSWPNIYISNQHYVACDNNFVDVPQIVDSIVENWEQWREKRINSRNILLQNYWNEEVLGMHLKEIFDRCCKRIK